MDERMSEQSSATGQKTAQRASRDRRLRIIAGVSVAAFAVLVIAFFTSRADIFMSQRANMNPSTNLGAGNSNSMPGMPGMNSNATMSATATPDMGGMAMGNGAGGMDMRPVDTSNAPAADPNARGNQPLEPTIGADGVKEFRLTASIIQWTILPGVQVGAYAYNGQVPGPLLRVTQGDRVRVILTNNLPEPTTIHWHGLVLDNGMDGAADVTQPPVEPGASFTYEFTVTQTGTYFYHTHKSADRQQTLGLYGALIIDPPPGTEPVYNGDYIVQLGEWTVQNGQNVPSMNQPGAFPNYFTINGKSYPSTETIQAKVGDRIRIRFIGTGQMIHPMHIHGGPFEIIATDGNPVPAGARLTKDTVLVGPGERYDVVWTALKPGKWLIHCHINDHITNNGVETQGGGGLTMVIEVSP